MKYYLPLKEIFQIPSVETKSYEKKNAFVYMVIITWKDIQKETKLEHFDYLNKNICIKHPKISCCSNFFSINLYALPLFQTGHLKLVIDLSFNHILL